jgi:hypothetical protein
MCLTLQIQNMSKLQDITVTLLEPLHPQPFKLLQEMYSVTWPSSPPLKDPQEIVDRMLKGQALPVPLESLTIIFGVRGLSRVALAQITRGRVGWGFVAESQMPEPVQHNVMVPSNIAEAFPDDVAQLLEASQRLYDKAIASGIPPQDARYLLLHGQTTSVVCSTNYLALRNFCSMRLENGLCDELNYITRLLLAEMRKAGPEWSYLVGFLDAKGGANYCYNTDDVFGNTGRAKSAPGVPTKVRYDFTKSWWYRELQALPPELLLPGESEMIADWQTIGFQGRLAKLAN